MGEFLAISSAVFFALSGIMVRRGAEYLDPEAGFLLSVIINALINTAAWAVASKGAMQVVSWPGLLWFLAGGAFTTLLGRWLWFKTIRSLGPSRAGTFKTGQTLFVLLASVLWLGETTTLPGLLGAAGIIGGLYLLGSEQAGKPRPEGVRWGGVATGLLSAGSFAVGNLARKLGMVAWTDPMAGAALGALAAAVGLLLIPGALGSLKRVVRSTAANRPWNFALVGALTSASHFTLYSALTVSPVWVVNILLAAEPLVLPFLGLRWLPGMEGLGRRLWLSTGLVVSGVVIIALR